MNGELQRASMLKRVSAWLLDVILLVVLATGVGLVTSAVVNFDQYDQALAQCQKEYEQRYGVSFELSQEEFAALSQEEQKYLNDAYGEFSKDPVAVYNYNMMISLSLVIVSISLVISCLVLEFAVPLLFGNGQTLGKKMFAIAVMKQNGVQVNAVTMFVRALLGKYTFETMIPLLILLMMLMGAIGIVGPLVILAILIMELVLMISSKTGATIHDKLAQTIVVDMHTQHIFKSEKERLAHNARVHEEKVKKQPY